MRTGFFALIIVALAVFGAGSAYAETVVVHGATYVNHSTHSYGNGSGSYGPSKNKYGAAADDYGPSKDKYVDTAPKTGSPTQTYKSPPSVQPAY